MINRKIALYVISLVRQTVEGSSLDQLEGNHDVPFPLHRHLLARSHLE